MPRKRKPGRPKGSTSARAAAASRLNGSRRSGGALDPALVGQTVVADDPARKAALEAMTKFQNERTELTRIRRLRQERELGIESHQLISASDVQTWITSVASAHRRICDNAIGLVETMDGVPPELMAPAKDLARRLSERLRNMFSTALKQAPGLKAIPA